MLDAGERDGAARDQVLEAAGRGDEDVGAPGGADLLLEADAAVDGGDLEAAGAGERPRLLDDLGGELARRARARAPPGARVGGSMRVDDRHGEGERLAGARGGLGEHVAAGEHVADDERWMAKGR